MTAAVIVVLLELAAITWILPSLYGYSARCQPRFRSVSEARWYL